MRQQTPVSSQSQLDPTYGQVRVREFERPMLSDEVETAQTIAYMEELAAFDAGEQHVIACAHEAMKDANLDPATANAFSKACAIFWWLKNHIRYVPTPATSPWVDQTLIAPSVLVQMQDPEGDCAQFSMLAAAMCRIFCVPCSFKTIAADPKYPTIYSHVYNVVDVGMCVMPFDSSNGPEPGAEYAIQCKARVWPQTLADDCKPKGKPTMIRDRMRPRGLGSIVCDDSGNCQDSDTGEALDPYTFQPIGTQGTVDPTIAANQISLTPAQTAPVILPAGYSISTAAPLSTGAGFGTTLANDLTTLLSPLTKAAAASTTKPYYVTNAQGQQVLYNPATGQVVGGALSSIGTSGWLLIAGIVVFIAMRNR